MPKNSIKKIDTDNSDKRRKDLAIIHIAKKQLGIDDSVYKAMLLNMAGVSTAADLDDNGRKNVIRHLKKCGFRPVHKSARRSGMHKKPARGKEPYLFKIGSILTELELPWGYVDAIAKQMFRIDRVRWLSVDQLQKVIIALMVAKRRKKNSN